MIWVVRAGKSSFYFDSFLEKNEIRLMWDGFKTNLNNLGTLENFKDLVKDEKGTTNKTTISNLGCQLFYFVREMKIGDFVLIPSKQSKKYALVKIISDYQYDINEIYPHFRKIVIVKNSIPREDFSLSTQYSLGAFRTIFHVKKDKEILKYIKCGDDDG